MDQVDHKAMAAGEREEVQENLQAKLENASEILDNLLTFTAVPNKPEGEKEWEEWKVRWMKRLLTVPQWKLNRWDEFKGEFVTGIWEFFDSLRLEPTSYEPLALPEPKTNIGKDSLKQIRALLSFDGTKKQKREFEKKGLQALHKKYPGAGFDRALSIRERGWN